MKTYDTSITSNLHTNATFNSAPVTMYFKVYENVCEFTTLNFKGRTS